MDNLTHTFVGGALAASGLGRRSPLATATLLIGANLPDLDALSYFRSPDLALSFRRGWTHGVLALVVLPPLLTAAMMLWDRVARGRGAPPVRPGELLLLAYLAVASHPLLDWLNTYGIRLLMPFDGRWLYGDTLFIIDPWLWLLLGGALFLGGSGSRRALVLWGGLGLLTTLIVIAGAPSAGARLLWLAGILLLAVLRLRWRPSARCAGRLAAAALALTVLYVGALMGGTALAEPEIRSALSAAGVAPLEDLMVGPVAAAPLRRDVVAVTAGGYRFGTYDWLSRPRFRLDERGLPRPGPEPVVEAALAAPSICGMAGWLRYPFVEVDELDDGWEIYVFDARYSRGRRRGFGVGRVRLGRDLAPVAGGD